MVPLWPVEPAVVGDVVVCRPRFEPGIVLFVSELFHWLKKKSCLSEIRIFRNFEAVGLFDKSDHFITFWY